MLVHLLRRWTNINPSEILNLNFQSLEVLFRYRNTQLQVTENVGGFNEIQVPTYISVSRLKAYFTLTTGYQRLYRC